jgi:hypothetical protein
VDARDPDPQRLAKWFYMALDGFRLVQKPAGNLASLSGLRKAFPLLLAFLQQEFMRVPFTRFHSFFFPSSLSLSKYSLLFFLYSYLFFFKLQ